SLTSPSTDSHSLCHLPPVLLSSPLLPLPRPPPTSTLFPYTTLFRSTTRTPTPHLPGVCLHRLGRTGPDPLPRRPPRSTHPLGPTHPHHHPPLQATTAQPPGRRHHTPPAAHRLPPRTPGGSAHVRTRRGRTDQTLRPQRRPEPQRLRRPLPESRICHPSRTGGSLGPPDHETGQ